MEKTTIKIRKAAPLDAANLLRLGHVAFEEHPVGYPPIDDRKAMIWVVSVINAGFTVVADLSGRIVGAIGLMPIQLPWTNEWVFKDDLFYVDPRFRDQGAGKMLLQAAEQIAQEQGLPFLLDIESGITPEKTGDWLEARNFHRIGGSYYKRPD